MKTKLLLLLLISTMSIQAQNTSNNEHRTVMCNFIIGIDTYSSIIKKVSHIKRKSITNNVLTIRDYKYGSLVGDIEFYFAFCMSVPYLTKHQF